ncbi:MAG: ABC transporter ATP-binding protein [Tissierellia bacterium]|nr:ABC transporter ATP-binding protein [Bacillota bacterium]NLL22858.1 ABC transporter ATP-binding protein [Tissierellia bacterium]
MKLLEVENLSVHYGTQTILKNINFSLGENQWLMVVGPNGAGKSTLINAISQYTNYTGVVRYLGKDLSTYKPRELAQNLGVLSQKHSVGFSFTVGEVVRLGRYAHAPGIFSQKSGQDEEKVQNALELTGLTNLINQSVLTLSGGELQRTFLAQVLAQDPKLLLLDEPSNHLDLVYQKQIFELVRRWLREEKRAAISVVHDLSLAKAYGTHALLLDKGGEVAKGEIEKVFSPKYLDAAYSMDVYAWMNKMLNQWK